MHCNAITFFEDHIECLVQGGYNVTFLIRFFFLKVLNCGTLDFVALTKLIWICSPKECGWKNQNLMRQKAVWVHFFFFFFSHWKPHIQICGWAMSYCHYETHWKKLIKLSEHFTFSGCFSCMAAKSPCPATHEHQTAFLPADVETKTQAQWCRFFGTFSALR